MSSYTLSFNEIGGDTPATVQLAPGQDIRVFSIYAEWDGSAAAGSFRPALSIVSPSGVRVSTTRPETIFAVGDTGVVTYAPFLHSETATPPAVLGSLPFVILGDLNPYNGYYDVWRVLETVLTDLTGYKDPAPFDDEQTNPRLSPNGAWVVYTENYPGASGGSVVDVVPAGGGTPVRLFDDAFGANTEHASWFPDSDGVIFAYGEGFTGRTAILKVLRSNPGGAPTTLWTPQYQPVQRENPYRPQVSPDGSKIAFLVNLSPGGGGDPSRQGLWVMNADGSGAALIDSFASGAATNRGYLFRGTQLAWSQDSAWIAYVSGGFGGGSQDVFKIAPDGSGKTLLKTGSGAGFANRIGHGAWVADGSKVICTGTDSGAAGWRIFALEADGSGETELIAAGAGPAGGNTFECAYRNPQDDRIYWIRTTTPGTVRSCLEDGSDDRLEASIAAISGTFYAGTGFEWL